MLMLSNRGAGGNQPSPLADPVMETVEIRNSATRTAFGHATDSPEQRKASSAAWRGPRKLLDDVMRATSEDNERQFVRLVDVDRLYQEAERWGIIDYQVPWLRQQWKSEVERLLYVPSNWTRHKIVDVQFSPDKQEALIYAYVWQVDGEELPMRFWMRLDNSRWRLFDWERLDLSFRTSLEWAITVQYQEDMRFDNFLEFYELLGEAVGHIDNYDLEAAKQPLIKAEELWHLTEVQDYTSLRLALAWSYIGDGDAMIRCADQVADKAAAPGAYYLIAIGQAANGDLEQALENMETYESLVGNQPRVLRAKAEYLAELDRKDESNDAWKRLLTILPGDTAARNTLAARFSGNRFDQLLPIIQQDPNPKQTAFEFAVRREGSDDVDAIDQVIAFLKKTAPESSELPAVEGIRLRMDGEHEASAAKFFAAMKMADNGSKEDIQYMYLYQMLTLEKMLEAYQAVEDPELAFEYFGEVYVDGEFDIEAEDIAALAEIHIQKYPQKMTGYYYAAEALSGQKKFAEAEALLRKGLETVSSPEPTDAQAEYDPLDSLRTQLATVMAEQGRGLEAYKSLSQKTEVFDVLAKHYQWKKSFEQLEELVAVHRENEPTHHLLDLYLGKVLASRNQFREADDALVRGHEAASEDYTQNRYLRTRVRTKYEAVMDIGEIYRELSSPSFDDAAIVYEELKSYLRRDRKWADFSTLLNQHAQKVEDPILLLRDRLEVAVAQANPSQIVRRLVPWPEDLDDNYSDWQQTSFQLQLVSALSKLKRLPEAIDIGKEVQRTHGDAGILALAYIANGKATELTELLKSDKARTAKKTLDQIDAGRSHYVKHWRTEPFRDLQLRFPRSMFAWHTDTSATLFSANAELPTLDEIKDAIQQIDTGAKVQAIRLDVTPSDITTTVVTVGEQRLVIYGRADKLLSEKRVQRISDESIRTAIEGHESWLTISDQSSADQGDTALLNKIAAAFITPETIVFHGDAQNRLARVNDELVAALNADDQKALSKLGDTYWLDHDVLSDEDSESTDQEKSRQIGRRELRRLATNPKTPLVPGAVTIEVRLSSGPLKEGISLRLHRVIESDYGTPSYVCELETPTHLRSNYQPGDIVTVPESVIQSWSVDDLP